MVSVADPKSITHLGSQRYEKVNLHEAENGYNRPGVVQEYVAQVGSEDRAA